MPLPLRESICRQRNLPRDEGVLRGRLELLSDEDRELLESVLLRGQSASSLARIMGVRPRGVRRRVHRLVRRVTARSFLDAARALDYLPAGDAELARLHFCQGLSQRELCRRLKVTSHALRRRLDHITAEIATIRRMHRAAAVPEPAHHALKTA
jgi:DNA-directed RNA polymerase specialized sigma24 family protein